jgi:hypothetical protein
MSPHDLMVRVGRICPPIARLHDQRNALLAATAALEREVLTLTTERNHLTAEIERASQNGVGAAGTIEAELVDLTSERDRLRTQVERLSNDALRVASRREQGYACEFDYPYSPRVRRWDGIPGGNPYRRILASRIDRYCELLSSFLVYADSFTAISAAETTDEREPHWNNPWLPSLDAICLSGLVATLNPKRYVEVGSGNSTKFVRRAISKHGLRTRVISIDPHPRAVIDDLCDEVIRTPLENCDLRVFEDLGPEDVLFIDNSHRSFQNSDVTVFFTEILPCLNAGCYYGIHDIFLPNDYPVEWLSRYYNEQYLLMAYLLGGASGDEIIMPVHFLQQTAELLSILDPIVTHPSLEGVAAVGGAVWMRKA